MFISLLYKGTRKMNVTKVTLMQKYLQLWRNGVKNVHSGYGKGRRVRSKGLPPRGGLKKEIVHDEKRTSPRRWAVNPHAALPGGVFGLSSAGAFSSCMSSIGGDSLCKAAICASAGGGAFCVCRGANHHNPRGLRSPRSLWRLRRRSPSAA